MTIPNGNGKSTFLFTSLSLPQTAYYYCVYSSPTQTAYETLLINL